MHVHSAVWIQIEILLGCKLQQSKSVKGGSLPPLLSCHLSAATKHVLR